MTTDTHPQLEQLLDYLENPKATEHTELRRHIAGCAQCRKQITGLNTLTETLSIAVANVKMTEVPNKLIEDFVDGKLKDPQRHEAQAKINQNKDALKAALHYATHSSAMRSAEKATQTHATSSTANTQTGLFQRLFAWRPPALTTIPLTAAAAFALAITLLPVMVPLLDKQDDTTLAVAAFQDHAVLTLQAPEADTPGMGFFNTAQQREAPFAGMQMQYDPQSGVTMHWPAVEAAKNYHLQLSVITNKGKQFLAETNSQLPQAYFKNLTLEAGRHYQWVLTGATESGLSFRTDGGFAVSEVNQ